MKMDKTRRIADELNRGRYSENVLEYFFDKTDADFTDSEEECSDDETDCIILENIPYLQMTLAEDEDEEESLGMVSEELDRKIADAISAVTFEEKDIEMEKIRNFDCKCYKQRKEDSLLGAQSCSHKLSPELMYDIRMDSKAAERDWQDMRIIGHLESNRRTVRTSEMTTSIRRKVQTKRQRARTTFLIGGSVICRQTFLFLMGIGKNTLCDIVRHFEQNGARPRLRKKQSRPRPGSITSEDIYRVVEFIKNYAEDNSVMLPGRHPGHKDWHMKLLPTHVTKASVWRLYMKTAKELGERAVCKTSFRSLWTQLLPHIRSCRPRTDLCWKCQSNNDQLIRSANLSEDRKSEAVQQQYDHLSLVQKERAVYKDMTDVCSATCSQFNLSLGPSLPASKDITMHYSFDFAQQMHFPSNPLQPGPMYFLTPRKCGLFGVSCEGMQKQVNYLIDEGMTSRKGSNEVISYMHHFFSNFGVGETKVDLHCDNCSGQNKNNFMLWYAAWRVGHKLHKTVAIHFLIAGHTKFSPDCGFGLIKQGYVKTRVDTLADIAEVVENSSPVSHVNIPQLVGTADGTVLVNVFDWQKHLTCHFRRLPKIKNYQHFSFDAERPGVVLAKTHWGAEPVEYQLLRDGADLPPINGLPVLAPPGLNIDRQTYLYEKIRPYCAVAARDVTCPAPKITAQKSPHKRMRI